MSKIKNYERFRELCKDKKYALAYAMSAKFTKLQETTEFIKMEKSFQISFENAQKLILLNLPDQAKEQINKYITVLSKRDLLQLIINNDEYFRNFLLAYSNNDFVTCYEIIDKHKKIKLLKTSTLLEMHWNQLVSKCESYATQGNISAVKSTLANLIHIKSRADKIGDLLRLSFHIKIKQLLDINSFTSAEAIIYSYIDIFGIDAEIKNLMTKFEKNSSLILAITHQEKKVSKYAWRDSKIIMSSDS